MNARIVFVIFYSIVKSGSAGIIRHKILTVSEVPLLHVQSGMVTNRLPRGFPCTVVTSKKALNLINS